MMWALADNLSDTWHIVRGADAAPIARCNNKILLDSENMTAHPPPVGRLCGRCQNIEWQQERSSNARDG